MRQSSRGLVSALVFLVTALVGTLAFAQGGAASSSLSGMVVDSSGAMLPGATVTIKNDATAGAFDTVSSDKGAFTIPALQPGTYTATVALTGFKKAVVPKVVINAGTPATLRVTLEVGNREESVTVTGGADIVQTQSSTIATTVDMNQVSNLPLVSRNAMDVITFLPGVLTPGGNRDSIVNGLPQGAINITIDGINVQDNFLKTTDGFFARLSPRLDAVEQVTVTTAAQGAESAGQGGVQIRFTTRSGSNELSGSVYHYFQHHKLNSNTWFNNRDLPPDPRTGKAPRDEAIQNQPGFRLGGPIVIPGLWDGHDKGFFFVNYEEFRQPLHVTRNRTILHPRAQQGIFRYNVTVGGQSQVREVNLLALAAANGHVSTMDPTVARLLDDIRRATATTGAISDLADPDLQRYTFQNEQRSINRYPTVRLDFNLSAKHRLTAAFSRQTTLSDPDTLNGADPNFPGSPTVGSQSSVRWTGSSSLRSTLGQNLVNELRLGGSGGPTRFSPELDSGMYRGTSSFDQGGFLLAISAADITNATLGGTPSSRQVRSKVLEDDLHWVKGAHGLSFGASLTQYDLWVRNQTLVPTVNFGVVTGDPVDGIFTTANFPGASNADLTNARNLYAVLTGRVSSINANARLDEITNHYGFLGLGTQRARMREMGFYAQDAWRIRPSLTLNYGLRYELQLPFTPLNDSYSTATMEDIWGVSGVGNLFKPGVLTGRPPQFNHFEKGDPANNTDWNNLAPNLGFAWRPSVGGGLLRLVLGSEPVIRGGYSLAYNRNGMSDFSDYFDNNPGAILTLNRTQAIGNLGALPLLLRERDRLGSPAFSETPVYPMSDVVTGDISIFDPDLEVPYSQSWTLGLQRKLTQDTALEVRYVGTRHLKGWGTFNYNSEVNIVENGFLDEFRRAQANLQANLAAGRGSNFRYYGPGTGTVPLPIFLAYFSGMPAGLAGDPALYASALFANNNFLNPLARFNPSPFGAAGLLDDDAARRANALRAGLPSNFLVPNPDLLGGANVVGNTGYTRFESMQVELRRRMAGGLDVQASYVFGKAFESSRYSLRRSRRRILNTGAEGSVAHALKAAWVYELPFGHDRRFNLGGMLDRVLGGWSFHGTARVQSGRLVNFGNVRLVGMSPEDVQKMFKLRFAENGRVYMLPQDVIDNTLKAFSVSATSATGYGNLGPPSGRYFAPANGPDCIEIASGDCGLGNLIVTGPMFRRFDLSLVKQIPLRKRLGIEFRAEMLNAFNNVNFIPVTGIGSTADNYEVTQAYSGRVVQLVSRISW